MSSNPHQSKKFKTSDGSVPERPTPDSGEETESEQDGEVAPVEEKPRKLGPNPTPPGNCLHPEEALSVHAKERTKLLSPLGDHCVFTHLPSVPEMSLADTLKMNFIHLGERSIDELKLPTLEFLTGEEAGSVNVASSLNAMYGINKLHKAFDKPNHTFALCPNKALLEAIATQYGYSPPGTVNTSTVDLTSSSFRADIKAFWRSKEIRDKDEHGNATTRDYTLIAFGDFAEPILRWHLDEHFLSTGQHTSHVLPYEHLKVQLNSGLRFVVWNFVAKAAKCHPSRKLNRDQMHLYRIAVALGTIWSGLVLPTPFYKPKLALFDEDPTLPGEGETGATRSLRPRSPGGSKVASKSAKSASGSTTQKAPATSGSTKSGASRKRKSRKAHSDALPGPSGTTDRPIRPLPAPRADV